jgi:galactokinase
VSLIGEHTDYNDGFVLPLAIDRDVIIAASKEDEPALKMYSLNFESSSVCPLAKIEKDPANPWSDYIRGIAAVLGGKGISIGGATMAIEGNVPLGSGLSSSAALEVAAGMAFQALFGFSMSGPDMALLSQAAENSFVGVNCGIMDQFISRLGAKNHALFVDCRTLDYKLVPLPESGISVVVGNTMKKRGLVDSEYNTRRKQCEEAVAILGKHIPNVTALRDVSVADFEKYSHLLPADIRARAEHVVMEDDRVLKSVEVLESGDMEAFGALLNQSHESLRDLYQVSCRELDVMVEAARSIPGVLGSRMTGAGFGGCTVNLVKDEAVPTFLKDVTARYQEETGIQPQMYVCKPENGAEVVAE